MKEREKENILDEIKRKIEAQINITIGFKWGFKFIDMKDGTVLDTSTKLIWLKDIDAVGSENWTKAKKKASDLASGLYNLNDGSAVGDWHLPTVEELRTISGLSNKLVPWPGRKGWYWSRTEDPTYPETQALVVNLAGGAPNNRPKDKQGRVVAVRKYKW